MFLMQVHTVHMLHIHSYSMVVMIFFIQSPSVKAVFQKKKIVHFTAPFHFRTTHCASAPLLWYLWSVSRYAAALRKKAVSTPLALKSLMKNGTWHLVSVSKTQKITQKWSQWSVFATGYFHNNCRASASVHARSSDSLPWKAAMVTFRLLRVSLSWSQWSQIIPDLRLLQGFFWLINVNSAQQNPISPLTSQEKTRINTGNQAETGPG